MTKTRVLVVEDSLTVRRYLCGVLAADPDIEVIGEAEDGRRAIQLCNERRPDVVSMDMVLPLMSGLAATEYIMAHCPTPILIVSASMNRGELFHTYDALAAGAVDVMEKPDGASDDAAWNRAFIASLKLVARIKVITHPRGRLGALGQASPGATPATGASLLPARSAPGIVALGASTGGPGAIVHILRALPAPFERPLLLVLHLSEPFGAAFAEWLDGQSAHRVAYAKDGEPLRAGGVVLAPPGRHLVVRSGKLRLTDDLPRHSCRPSIDLLFESLASEHGGDVLACLLTGMGRDGAAGLLAIRNAGGFTIAQDEASSVVYGMPREAALLGAAERVLSIERIGPAISELVTRPAQRLP
jgi:two-component system, chemotaxis family, protein-glutamate methylesterase/glutaminase